MIFFLEASFDFANFFPDLCVCVFCVLNKAKKGNLWPLLQWPLWQWVFALICCSISAREGLHIVRDVSKIASSVGVYRSAFRFGLCHLLAVIVVKLFSFCHYAIKTNGLNLRHILPSWCLFTGCLLPYVVLKLGPTTRNLSIISVKGQRTLENHLTPVKSYNALPRNN